MSEEELQIIDNIRRKGFRPQVVGCFVCENKILFLFKKDHKLWQFPQGGIENDETIKEALVREMHEELEDTFLKNCNFSKIEIFDENQILFSKKSKGIRALKTDSEKEIKMLGKRYLFIKVPTDKKEIKITQTEFDKYRWLNQRDSITLVKKIKQLGKKRIILKALGKINFS
jgi:NADH pyrophosphatase NudC (nudix superfamily)